MHSMQLSAHVENNGLLQIQLPAEFSGQDVDLVLVIQAHQTTFDSIEDQEDLKLLQDTRNEKTISLAEYLQNAD
ncbi:MAG: hypothetical protein QX190_03400 [Methylococcales bacterium]